MQYLLWTSYYMKMHLITIKSKTACLHQTYLVKKNKDNLDWWRVQPNLLRRKLKSFDSLVVVRRSVYNSRRTATNFNSTIKIAFCFVLFVCLFVCLFSFSLGSFIRLFSWFLSFFQLNMKYYQTISSIFFLHAVY